MFQAVPWPLVSIVFFQRSTTVWPNVSCLVLCWAWARGRPIKWSLCRPRYLCHRSVQRYEVLQFYFLVRQFFFIFLFYILYSVLILVLFFLFSFEFIWLLTRNSFSFFSFFLFFLGCGFFVSVPKNCSFLLFSFLYFYEALFVSFFFFSSQLRKGDMITVHLNSINSIVRSY